MGLGLGRGLPLYDLLIVGMLIRCLSGLLRSPSHQVKLFKKWKIFLNPILSDGVFIFKIHIIEAEIVIK